MSGAAAEHEGEEPDHSCGIAAEGIGDVKGPVSSAVHILSCIEQRPRWSRESRG